MEQRRDGETLAERGDIAEELSVARDCRDLEVAGGRGHLDDGGELDVFQGASAPGVGFLVGFFELRPVQIRLFL